MKLTDGNKVSIVAGVSLLCLGVVLSMFYMFQMYHGL
jgi:hypothetical protein